MDRPDLVEETLLLAAVIEDEQQPRNKRRKVWVHDINTRREQEGEFHTLYQQLREHEERFYIYFRMSIECLDEILALVEGDIQKEYTNYRKPVEPAERLAVTLRYLASGDSYTTIGHSFRMGFSTVSSIVQEVCSAIWKRLQPIYMPEPNRETWERSISGFQDVWQYPNCMRSVDGKQVTVKCPDKTDVGGYGKNSDGGVFETSLMGQKLLTGTLNTPPDGPLPGQAEPTPCLLIGDEAFPLRSNLMRPFPYRQTRHDNTKHVYNKRLCRARRVVENAFGILAQKWRVFYRPIEVKVETVINIAKSTCVLHNYLRSKVSDQNLQLLLEAPEPILEAFENLPIDGRRATHEDFQIR